MTARWQKILAQGFVSSNALLRFLNLPAQCNELDNIFAVRVPLGFAARMQTQNAHDPLLLQVLASAQEQATPVGFTLDPLQENTNMVAPGLMHKYYGRVLLTVTGVCAVNCRYCFRRNFPYAANNPGRAGWQQALDYIRLDTTIHEVILSGGDPLLATTKVLSELIIAIETIKHIKTLRVHTRIPIVLPERIDSEFLTFWQQIRLNKVIVLHCNHAQEIDYTVQSVCKLLIQHGTTLLNQSVLLKGINDDIMTLSGLSHALFAMHVLPYYLHLLDRVIGAAHFEVSDLAAQQLYRNLQLQLPGYLVPKLVREIPGIGCKVLQ